MREDLSRYPDGRASVPASRFTGSIATSPPAPTPEELGALVESECEILSHCLAYVHLLRIEEGQGEGTWQDVVRYLNVLHSAESLGGDQEAPGAFRESPLPLWPVSDRATAATVRSTESPPDASSTIQSEPTSPKSGTTKEEPRDWIERQLEKLSPPSASFARRLLSRAARGLESVLTPDQLREALPDHSFPHWLHFVVQRLVREAQTLVIQELWEHYHSALEAAAADNEFRRHKSALAAMGDRAQVAKQMRRVHLTQWEELSSRHTSRLDAFLSPMMILGIAYMPAVVADSSWETGFLFFAPNLIVLAVLYALRNSTTEKAQLLFSSLLALQGAFYLFLMLWLPLVAPDHASATVLMILFMATFWFLLGAYFELRKQRRLGRKRALLQIPHGIEGKP